MITINGYSIQEYPRQDKIVISLPPQTQGKEMFLNNSEQVAILAIVKNAYERVEKGAE